MKSKLDFSVGTNSWFDFWHTHIDWDGKGNKSFKIRENYLKQLLSQFDEIKLELKKYPNEFQTWIVIDETDSGEDAIYIHTKNPNQDNFPLKIEINESWNCDDKQLSKFMEETGLTIIEVPYLEGKGFYLFDQKFGVSIIK